MSRIIEDKFREWTHGKNPEEARISVYNHVRDIPYAVIPELNHPVDYIKILSINKGSCTPKHFLLGNLFRMLHLPVLYIVYQYKWDEFEYLYPEDLKKLAKAMPAGNHLACKVEIDGNLVLVDATLDSNLAALGLPVNTDWNGKDDTLLPVIPTGEEMIYHWSEAELMEKPVVDFNMQHFYDSLNSWLESVRNTDEHK